MTPIATVEFGGIRRDIAIPSAKISPPDGEFGDYEVYVAGANFDTQVTLLDGTIEKIVRKPREGKSRLQFDQVPVKEVTLKPGIKVQLHFS